MRAKFKQEFVGIKSYNEKGQAGFCVNYKANISKEDRQALQEFIENDFFTNKFSYECIKLHTAEQIETYRTKMSETKIWKSLIFEKYFEMSQELELIAETHHMDQILRLFNITLVKENKLDEVKNEPIENAEFNMTGLKWYQIKLLKQSSLFTVLRTSCKDLVIDFVEEQLKFESQKSEDIDKARLLVVNMLKKVKGIELLGRNEHENGVLRKIVANLAENEDFYDKVLIQGGICCVLDAKSIVGKLFVYGYNMEDLARCEEILFK